MRKWCLNLALKCSEHFKKQKDNESPFTRCAVICNPDSSSIGKKNLVSACKRDEKYSCNSLNHGPSIESGCLCLSHSSALQLLFKDSLYNLVEKPGSIEETSELLSFIH